MNIQAPAWVNPNTPTSSISDGGCDVYTISTQNHVFQWTPPVVSAAPAATFIYDLRIVELIDGQAIDYLMAKAPVFFKKNGLIVPQIIIRQMLSRIFAPAIFMLFKSQQNKEPLPPRLAQNLWLFLPYRVQ